MSTPHSDTTSIRVRDADYEVIRGMGVQFGLAIPEMIGAAVDAFKAIPANKRGKIIDRRRQSGAVRRLRRPVAA